MVCILTLQILEFTTGSEKVCCNEANAAAAAQGDLKQTKQCREIFGTLNNACYLGQPTLLAVQRHSELSPLSAAAEEILPLNHKTPQTCNACNGGVQQMQLTAKFQPHILKVGGVVYFRSGNIVRHVTSYLALGLKKKGLALPRLDWVLNLVLVDLQQDVWETCIVFSAGKPLSRCEFQHGGGWRQHVSLAMNLVGGTGTARPTVLLLTALAQHRPGCALLRGANKCSILLVSYGVNTLHAIRFLSE